MKLSLIIPPELGSMSWSDLAAWVAGAGYDAIDAEANTDPAAVAALVDAGLEAGPLRIRASLADSDPASRRDAVRSAVDEIARAAELGLATVWTLPRNFRNDASRRDNLTAAVDSLAEVATHAERHGIRVAIENCPFDGQNAVCTPEAWDVLFAAVPSHALGICLDPSHCVWQGIDHRRVIAEYRDRLYHVHAKDTELLDEGRYRYGVEGRILDAVPADDTAPSGWWRHRLPGLGALDWNGVVSALVDAGYDGSVSVEHEDPLWGGNQERVQRGLVRARTHLEQFIPRP